MKIINSTTNKILAEKVVVADSFFLRMKGLLGKKALNVGEALIITHCQSIHMFFMQFAIDAVFVSKSKKVVGVVKEIKPFQLSRIFFKSDFVIELPVGVIDKTNTKVGDFLELV